MFSETIRRKFLHYFKDQGHQIIPSSAVVPHGDPTLLFTNAGMNQFKDLFLGKSARDYKRAATSQKCIRAGGKHNDLENVGHTSRHLTFFEMIGNFSFGDYFKKEAIAYGWDVVTKVFELDPKFIWATVFYEDEESFALWEKYLPSERIVRMGEKDNFWSMGDTGPCGPCSELLYDRGHQFGSARNPAEDSGGERFFEFWNLVFMEFNRQNDGILEKLPSQSVDTGAGLERIVSLKMGVDSLFETDILRELIAGIEKSFHIVYDPGEKNAPAFRVIADHLRSLSFAIADGAQPSNTDRGYVLRKILRRAVRYGRMLGQDTPFLAKILPRLITTMGGAYPELKAAEQRIGEILTVEEESFFRTLRKGGNMLQQILSSSHQSGNMLSGEDCFKLKDTYGLPLEEISLIARDSSLQIDLAAFQRLETEAKLRSKGAKKEKESSGKEEIYKEQEPTIFLGYSEVTSQAKIKALFKEGEPTQELFEGENGVLLLDQTPFYAEKGGQIGDQGTIESEKGSFLVSDCTSPYPEIILHHGLVQKGSVKIGDVVQARVDSSRRQKIANNHTATHLLHYALNEVLGSHVKQAGSVVEPGRLRFDFNHHKSLTPEEIVKIESMVNQLIRENTPVKTYEISYDEAVTKKEIKQFFGEKYGRHVRVVDIEASKELCGGIHTSQTGTIGLFKIVKEASISAGVRRIEAVTGSEAEKVIHEQIESLQDLAALLKAQPGQLKEKISSILQEQKDLAQELNLLRKEKLQVIVNQLLAKAIQKRGTSIIIEEVDIDPKELVEVLFAKSPSLAVALFRKSEGRCSYLFKISRDLVEQGLRADAWMKEAADVLGGKGGGRQDMAQGSGHQIAELGASLIKSRSWIEEFFKKDS